MLDIASRSDPSSKAPLFIVPRGMKSWFSDLGIQNAVELDWWDKHLYKDVAFNFTPVQHWSARSLGDRSQTLWDDYAVLAPGLHWYFAGELGAKRSVGIHWGTFKLTDESLDQSPRDLASAATAQGVRAQDFTMMAIGETRRLSTRRVHP